MPTPTLDLTEADIITALGNFLVSIVPNGVAVFRGQDNRVPEPAGTDFVVMTPTLRERLGTNVDTWAYIQAPTTLAELNGVKVTIQLDVHGPNSTDNAQVISTLIRDDYAVQSFLASGFDVAPLYASEPRQLPFLNAEDQYETRWVVDAVLQANPVVTVAQDFADELEANLFRADA